LTPPLLALKLGCSPSPTAYGTDKDQKDVLQTIAACASNYSSTIISTHSTQLWDSLKFEVFNAQEEDLAAEALAVIRAIAVKLSFGLTSATPQSALARFLRPIIAECNERLREPQQKQARPAGQILGSLATASPVAFASTVKAVVAPLLTLYQDMGGIGKQRALLEVLGQLFESALTVYGFWGSMEVYPQVKNPLDAFRDQLFEIFCQALMGTATTEVSFRIVALRGLLQLAMLRRFLAENEIGMVIQYLNEIVLEEDPDGKVDLKEEAIQALVRISGIKSRLIMDITFPAFMAKLPDSDMDGANHYIRTLEGLAKLGAEREIFQVLMRRLLNKLDIVLQNNSSQAYPKAILSTLHYVFSLQSLEDDPNLQVYYDRLVSGLIRKAVHPLQGIGNTTALNDEGILEVIGRLANLIVRSLDANRQQSMVSEVFNLYGSQQMDQFNPLAVDASPKQRQTIILSSYLLAGIRREVGQTWT
jgi:DNA repair/transcription protein MET18/MMS19